MMQMRFARSRPTIGSVCAQPWAATRVDSPDPFRSVAKRAGGPSRMPYQPNPGAIPGSEGTPSALATPAGFLPKAALMAPLKAPLCRFPPMVGCRRAAGSRKFHGDDSVGGPTPWLRLSSNSTGWEQPGPAAGHALPLEQFLPKGCWALPAVAQPPAPGIVFLSNAARIYALRVIGHSLASGSSRMA